MTQNEPTPVGDKLPPTESHVETLKRLSELQKRSLKGDQIPFAVNCAFTDFAAIASHVESLESHVQFLADVRAELLAEVERLQEIVDKLPKTADGVPVTPGDAVFPPCGHSDPLTPDCFVPVWVNKVSCWEGSCKREDFGENDYHETSPTKYLVGNCFSTREAAEAAAKLRRSCGEAAAKGSAR